MSCCHVLDLRLRPQGLTPSMYLYPQLRELRPGTRLRIWSPDEPTLLMAQLQNHLRHALVWSAVTDGQGYLITLHIRSPEEALSLTDTMRRDHDDMDYALVAALEALRDARPGVAVAAMTRLDHALRVHILIENELLAPLTAHCAAEPTALMRREHDDILLQLDAIAEACAGGDQAHELDIWLSLLAASLNKHEFREETLLFPAWERAVRDDAGRQPLLAEVRRRLAAAS